MSRIVREIERERERDKVRKKKKCTTTSTTRTIAGTRTQPLAPIFTRRPSPSPTKVPLPTHPPTQSTPRSNIFAQFAHLPTPPQTTAAQPTMPHRHNSQQTAANTTPTRHISENEEAKQSPKQEKNMFERFRHM